MSTSKHTSEGKDALYRFIAQAAAGQVMGLYRANRHFSDEAPHFVTLALCDYLNKCWMSLLREDDAFVSQSFCNTGHHSPVCLMNKIQVIAQKIAQEMLREIRSFICAARGNVDMLRYCLHTAAMYTITSSPQFMDVLSVHECRGKTLEQERQAWIETGREEVEFFKAVARLVEEEPR